MFKQMLLVPEFVVFRIAKILTNQKNINCGKIKSPKLQKIEDWF